MQLPWLSRVTLGSHTVQYPRTVIHSPMPYHTPIETLYIQYTLMFLLFTIQPYCRKWIWKVWNLELG